MALVLVVVGLLAVSPVGEVELFTRTGCPHCAQAHRFLEGLKAERPGLTVIEWQVDQDPRARERLEQLAAEHGQAVVGVPAMLVGGELMFGFAETTEARVRARLERQPLPTGPRPGETCSADPAERCDDDVVQAPFWGAVRASELGLPLFTVLVGLLDGFNPCAMWVLLFLLSLLVNMKSRARMALVAGTFVVVSGVVYFAFMAAWLNVFLLLGFSRVVQVVLGGLAVAMAALNIKEFWAFKKGPSLTIPEAAKPGIATRIRGVLQARGLAAALAGVVVLAVLVNFVELLCTAGFPAVYTHVLTGRGLPEWQNYAFLGLYIVAYVFDDALMVGVAVVTLSRRRLQEREGRWLKLVSGVVMLGLAGVLLFKPAWLSALG